MESTTTIKQYVLPCEFWSIAPISRIQILNLGKYKYTRLCSVFGRPKTEQSLVAQDKSS